MSDYKIGNIYKIIHNQSNICYIGSTFQKLKDRWYSHKCNKVKSTKCCIDKYFEEFGIENFSIILVKSYEVIDKKHLESKEVLWISKLSTIQQNNSFHIKKVSNKNYRENQDKEKVKEYNKNYHEQYKIDKKEEIKERSRLYRLNNQEKLKETYICECGKELTKAKKSRHIKTKYHLANI